jgi:hypothetical protein
MRGSKNIVLRIPPFGQIMFRGKKIEKSRQPVPKFILPNLGEFLISHLALYAGKYILFVQGFGIKGRIREGNGRLFRKGLVKQL